MNRRSIMRWTAGMMLVLSGATAAPVSAGQSARRETPVVEIIDRSVAARLPPGARLEPLIRQRDGFFEGPSWVGGQDGYLVVSDIPGNRLLRIDRGGRVSTAVDRVNRGPTAGAIHDTLYTNRDLIGSNGTFAAGSKRLLVCIFAGHRLEAIDLATGRREAIAQGTPALPIDAPNDVTVGPDGDIYFSAHGGLYRVHAGVTKLFRKMAANGLAFSPDGRVLYATDGATTVLRIAVNSDGSAGTATTFLDTHGDATKDEFLDGMKIDRRGNLWMVAPGGLWVVAPDGRLLAKVRAPDAAMPTGVHHRFTNLAFDADGGALYLTAPGGVYRLRLRGGSARPAG